MFLIPLVFFEIYRPSLKTRKTNDQNKKSKTKLEKLRQNLKKVSVESKQKSPDLEYTSLKLRRKCSFFMWIPLFLKLSPLGSRGKTWSGFPVDFQILCFEYCLMSTLIEEVLFSFKYNKKCSTKSKNHICY